VAVSNATKVCPAAAQKQSEKNNTLTDVIIDEIVPNLHNTKNRR
jgi:hypothetical protein